MPKLNERIKAAAIMSGAEIIPVQDDLPKLQFTVEQLVDFWGICKFFDSGGQAGEFNKSGPRVNTGKTRRNYYQMTPIEDGEKFSPLGKMLREARLKRNMALNVVGNFCGLSPQSVSGWEHGKNAPSRQSLMKLSELFDISLEDLLSEAAKEYTNA